MLENSFYQVSELTTQKEKAEAKITLNPNHDIYKGHFPDNPVTPGVCQIQIVKEILGRILEIPCQLVAAKNIKFLNVLTPERKGLHLTMAYHTSNNQIQVKALLNAGDMVFLKLDATFRSDYSPSP